jgi:ABC-type glycerol-3-phosphate transport system substrate-binding protein
VRWLKRYTGRLSTMPTTVKMGRLVAKNSYTEEKDVIIDTMNMPVLRDVRANYIKSIGEDVIISDKVYGLPLAADSLAIYYNRDILDRAGVAEPPKNWEEFMDAVMKTTKFNAAGDIVQSGVALGTSSNIDNSADLLALFMSQSGVKVTQGNYVRFADGLEKANENSPVIKALRFYTDFANPTKKAYSWNEKMGNALDQFARGKVAFYFGYAYDYPGIKSRAPQMNMEILPMFQLNPDSPSNVINYWVQSVVKKSKNQNEAWDFVRFITTQENVKTYTEATFRPSPYRSQIVEQQKNVNLAPFASQVLFAQNWYRGKNVDVATNALKNLVTDYLKPYGEGDPIKRDVKLIINAATLVQQTM